MPKGSKELTEARREEIIAACTQLYKTMNFKDIRIKDIAEYTSFTRTSIYNYFQTKEEIFLALLQQEYEKWNDRLEKLWDETDAMTRVQFADAIARSLQERGTLLKILSMNHYDMEENSRMERLVDFKKEYGRSLSCIRKGLEKFFPEISEEEKEEFIFSFFPFMFGIYPYTFVSEKQKEAMQKAQVEYVYMGIYEITFAEVKRLLHV